MPELRVPCAPPRWAKPVFVASLFAGATLRIWVSTLGYNDDFLAWSRVASVMAAGKNVYASTKYTYGPIWAEMLQLSNPESARGPERPPHCGQPPAKLAASSGPNARLYTWKFMSELWAAGLPEG
jgi:hypothetical protein